MPFSFSVFLEGLGTSAGLIIAIGAQNAFVLKQGIKKQYVFATAALCAAIDLVLITAGVLGLGAIIEQSKVLLYIAGTIGTLFLLWYGFRSFRAALKPQIMESERSDVSNGLGKTLATVLALSLLNPHVYLDTVVLLGSIGGRHVLDDRLSFILGSCTASILWFFCLAYGAGLLAPLFKKAITWRILDFAIAGVMWLIAVQLAIFVIGQAGA